MIPDIAQIRNEIAQEAVRCRVCGGRVRFESHDYVSHATIEVVARCHGSTETFEFEPDALATSDISPYGRLYKWLRNLFAADLIPDVVELVRSNREPFGVAAWKGGER